MPTTWTFNPLYSILSIPGAKPSIFAKNYLFLADFGVPPPSQYAHPTATKCLKWQIYNPCQVPSRPVANKNTLRVHHRVPFALETNQCSAYGLREFLSAIPWARFGPSIYRPNKTFSAVNPRTNIPRRAPLRSLIDTYMAKDSGFCQLLYLCVFRAKKADFSLLSKCCITYVYACCTYFRYTFDDFCWKTPTPFSYRKILYLHTKCILLHPLSAPIL